MLLLGSDNQITFKLALTGTQQEPSVRVILNLDPAVMYIAEPVGEGKWSVNMKIPEAAEPGEYDFCVEVAVGGRLFTPLKNKIDIGKIEVSIEDFSFGNEPTPKVEPVKVPFEIESARVPEKYEVEVVEEKKSKQDLGEFLLQALKSTPKEPTKATLKTEPLVESEVVIPKKDFSHLSEADKLRILAGIKPLK